MLESAGARHGACRRFGLTRVRVETSLRSAAFSGREAQPIRSTWNFREGSGNATKMRIVYSLKRAQRAACVFFILLLALSPVLAQEALAPQAQAPAAALT